MFIKSTAVPIRYGVYGEHNTYVGDLVYYDGDWNFDGTDADIFVNKYQLKEIMMLLDSLETPSVKDRKIRKEN